jgi:hypothetical protein
MGTYRLKPPHILNNPVYSHIWSDVYEKDLDALIAVCGRRGYCKSGSAETFGWAFDLDYLGAHRFSVEEHVFFRASEFSKQIEEKWPKGTVFIWDEVGVENDSRSWYSTKNKFIKYIMETYRDKNYVLLVTAPHLKSMDIATQRLLTGYLEMRGKTKDGNSAKGKFEHVEHNPKTGKSYYKMPRYWDKSTWPSMFYKANEVIFPKPPDKLDLKYKAKKLEYQKNLYHNISDELTYMAKIISSQDEIGKKNNYSLKDIVRLVSEHPEQYVGSKDKHGHKEFVSAIIECDLDVPARLAVQAARLLNIRRDYLFPNLSCMDPQKTTST